MTMMQGLSLTGVSASANAKKRGELWLSKCVSHIKAMHKLISSIFDGLENDDVYMEYDDNTVNIVKGDSTTHTHIFADHCYKLVTMMREPTNGPVEFPLSQIISILTRCLRVSHSDVVSVPSRSDLVSLLPCLHQSSMDVLAQLILCCGRDILFHSHVLIDLCLQTIVSTRKMTSIAKSSTRSSAYQALVVWIRTCGWGKYLSSHSKILIQELVADTQADADDRMGSKKETDESKEKKDTLGHKRKGKRKKGKKGDSYMELEAEDDGSQTKQITEERLDLILWAFSLSELTVENLPFSASQNLISHLIKTASTVQRLSSNRPEPYSRGEARKGLYKATASCLLSSLNSGCTRNDAVSHYQLTNAALDLLARACHGEETQIQEACSHALDILRSSANLKGPVIRKILDYEDSGVEDVSQLMREKEQMADSVEDLRQKLMNSELENEQQSRMISSLREQIVNFQSQVSTQNFEASQGNSELQTSKHKNDLTEDESDDDITDDVNDDQEESRSQGDNENVGVSNKQELSPISENNEKDKTVHGNEMKDSRLLSSKNTTDSKSMDVREELSTESKIRNNQLQKDDGKKTSKISSKRTKKSDGSPEKKVKRPKTDLGAGSSKEKSDMVQDMLLDFVDAPPDS